jgi:hypothetical protein
MFDDKKREADVRIRAAMEAFVRAGDTLLGATANSPFSARMYAIGVIDQRLIMAQVDRKIESRGDPVSVRARQMFVGDDQMHGKQAFLEFLHAARGLAR